MNFYGVTSFVIVLNIVTNDIFQTEKLITKQKRGVFSIYYSNCSKFITETATEISYSK